MDVAPTILSFFGLPVPPDMDGNEIPGVLEEISQRDRSKREPT
jgi:arylsulfatase A-like enzyme